MVIAGIIFTIIGLLIRLSAIMTLKNDFTWRIIPPNDFVSHGIYKYIRHPAYLGTLFLYFGLFLLVTKSLPITILFNVFTFNFILDRIDREEYTMLGKFGEKYWDYMQTTKMIFPFIGSR